MNRTLEDNPSVEKEFQNLVKDFYQKHANNPDNPEEYKYLLGYLANMNMVIIPQWYSKEAIEFFIGISPMTNEQWNDFNKVYNRNVGGMVDMINEELDDMLNSSYPIQEWLERNDY